MYEQLYGNDGRIWRFAISFQNAFSEICSKFEPKLWLHVDACWGGAAILSEKLKHLMSGSEKVDSLAYNAHKMLGQSMSGALSLLIGSI